MVIHHEQFAKIEDSRTKKLAKETVMIKEITAITVANSEMSEMRGKDSANYMLKNCKVPLMWDHKGSKMSTGPFLIVETMEKEQLLHLTDKILASI